MIILVERTFFHSSCTGLRWVNCQSLFSGLSLNHETLTWLTQTEKKSFCRRGRNCQSKTRSAILISRREVSKLVLPEESKTLIRGEVRGHNRRARLWSSNWLLMACTFAKERKVFHFAREWKCFSSPHPASPATFCCCAALLGWVEACWKRFAVFTASTATFCLHQREFNESLQRF